MVGARTLDPGGLRAAASSASWWVPCLGARSRHRPARSPTRRSPAARHHALDSGHHHGAGPGRHHRIGDGSPTILALNRLLFNAGPFVRLARSAALSVLQGISFVAAALYGPPAGVRSGRATGAGQHRRGAHRPVHALLRRRDSHRGGDFLPRCGPCRGPGIFRGVLNAPTRRRTRWAFPSPLALWPGPGHRDGRGWGSNHPGRRPCATCSDRQARAEGGIETAGARSPAACLPPPVGRGACTPRRGRADGRMEDTRLAGRGELRAGARVSFRLPGGADGPRGRNGSAVDDGPLAIILDGASAGRAGRRSGRILHAGRPC